MATSKPALWSATLAAVLLASTAQAATLTVSPGPDAQERLQTALLDAKPGDVVAFRAVMQMGALKNRIVVERIESRETLSLRLKPMTMIAPEAQASV